MLLRIDSSKIKSREAGGGGEEREGEKGRVEEEEAVVVAAAATASSKVYPRSWKFITFLSSRKNYKRKKEQSVGMDG